MYEQIKDYTLVVRVKVDVAVTKRLSCVSAATEAKGVNGTHGAKSSSQVHFCDFGVQITHVQRQTVLQVHRWLQ